MVITTDFNIFADKYHNKQYLPDDMISMIMNINTKEIQTEIKDTHEMWFHQSMNELHYYCDWLECNTENNMEEDEEEYDEETYVVLPERLLNLIKWNEKEGGGYEDSDEEDGSG